MRLIRKTFILMMVISLIGCRAITQPVSDFNEKEVQKQNDYGLRHRGEYGQIATTSHGMYIPTLEYLQYYDFEKEKWYYLCNKPNCLHGEETIQELGQECNAYLSNGSYGGFLSEPEIYYYKNYLYMFQLDIDFSTAIPSTTSLMRISLDGSNRERVLIVGPYTDSGHMSVVFCDDFLIYIDSSRNLIIKSLNDYGQMSGKTVESDLFSIQGASSCIAIDNSVYILADCFCDYFENRDYYGALIKFTPRENKVELIDDGLIFGHNAFMNVLGNNEIVYESNYELMIYNLIKKESILLFDNASEIYPTDNYYFTYNGDRYGMGIDNSKVIRVYDQERNLLDEFEDPDAYLLACGAFKDKFYNLRHYGGSNGGEVYLFEYSIENGKIKKSISLYHDQSSKLHGYKYQAKP